MNKCLELVRIKDNNIYSKIGQKTYYLIHLIAYKIIEYSFNITNGQVVCERPAIGEHGVLLCYLGIIFDGSLCFILIYTLFFSCNLRLLSKMKLL